MAHAYDRQVLQDPIFHSSFIAGKLEAVENQGFDQFKVDNVQCACELPASMTGNLEFAKEFSSETFETAHAEVHERQEFINRRAVAGGHLYGSLKGRA